MSDEPSTPANPPSDANNRGNNRGGYRGGYRPNRRRYSPKGDNQGVTALPDPEPILRKDPGAPAPDERPVNPNPPGARGQNNTNNSRRGKKDRTLPDRDRGPRRSDLPGQTSRATPGEGAAQDKKNENNEDNKNRPPAQKDQAGGTPPPPQNGERNDRRRRGRPPKTGGQNQPRQGGANGGPRGQSGQNRGQQGRPKQERPEGGPGSPQSGQGRPQNGPGRAQGAQGQQRSRPGEPKRPGGQSRRFAVRGESGKPQVLTRGEGAKKPRKPGGPGDQNFDYFKPPPIKTNAGIKARSQEGQYALSWWAARWISAMENLVDGRRLGRGRSYAKDGQVLSIEEKPGGVTAQVQGSRPKPYRVAIEVIPLADFEWEKVFDVLASQALFAAQLLAGEMPRNIEEAFDAAGTSLFPARLGDLHTDCTCPDWANPCKHVAATHYILAERFDEDPFLLFRLRGRTSEQILAALRERRSGSSEERLPEIPPLEEVQPVLPLTADADRFYSLGRTLEDFALSFKEPTIEMAVLKRLGDPNFLGQESLLATLDPVYRAVRAAALEAALGEAGGDEEEGNNGK